jgi:CheY-like chemotaxis protein
MARPQILVVEDDPTWAVLLADWLGSRYRLVAAGDGAAALAQVQAQPPDALVLDLHLPDMDGAEVLTRLRAMPAGRMIPVVVFSSAAHDVTLVRRLTALSEPGPLLFAAKGAKVDGLLSALRRALG